MDTHRNREQEMTRTTLIGSVGNVALMSFKMVAGIVGHSSAMVADALHSLSDLATDIALLFFVHISVKPQDDDHKYGHGKYETLATFLIGLALVGAAIAIMFAGIPKMLAWTRGDNIEVPGTIALWAALLSIAVKETLYRYTMAKARHANSPAMKANAWHHRSDALSSVAAAIGIGGAIFLGERWTVLDPLMSIVVAFMLLRVAWKMIRESINELTETALPKEEEEEILAIVRSFPDVSRPHNLRTRHIGTRTAIEFHVCMEGSTTIDSAQQHTRDIEETLRRRFGPDSIITIHVEPKK